MRLVSAKLHQSISFNINIESDLYDACNVEEISQIYYEGSRALQLTEWVLSLSTGIMNLVLVLPCCVADYRYYSKFLNGSQAQNKFTKPLTLHCNLQYWCLVNLFCLQTSNTPTDIIRLIITIVVSFCQMSVFILCCFLTLCLEVCEKEHSRVAGSMS